MKQTMHANDESNTNKQDKKEWEYTSVDNREGST